MKMKYTIQSIAAAGLFTLSTISHAAEPTPSASISPSPTTAAANQLFSPLKVLYSPQCLLYCIQRPSGQPQKCFYDPSVPQCAAKNHR
jgi:hypothetical protein